MPLSKNLLRIEDEKLIKITFFSLILIKLFLVIGQRMLAWPYQTYDDALMFNRAVSIINGKWLGTYNFITLSKGAFFPLWLAFLHLLSIPMLVGNQILYILSCLAFIWSIKTIVPNKKLLILFFAILLFNPVTFGYLYLLRVYRDGIFPSLVIFVLAGMIGMFLNKDNNKKMLICSIMASISLASAWHTREDAFWILPFVIVATVITAVFLAVDKIKKREEIIIKKFIYLCLPFILLFASNLLVSGLNYIAYGRFIVNDYMSRDFQSAYGALTRVEHEKFEYDIPVPEEARMKIYQVSPAFNELKPFLDEGFCDPWKASGGSLHDFYGGWFMWALRDAVSACGYYENPTKAKTYYERLAKEVNAACDNGFLPVRASKRTTLATPFSHEYITPTIKSAIDAILYIINYESIYPQTMSIIDFQWGPPLTDFESEIKGWELFLNQLAVRDNVENDIDSTNKIYSKRVEKLKHRCSNVLIRIYQFINLPVTLISVLTLLILTVLIFYRLHKKMEIYKYAEVIILWGLFFTFIGRVLMVAYVHVSSFSAINAMYLSSSYPIVIIFNCISMYCIYDIVRKFVKTHKKTEVTKV